MCHKRTLVPYQLGNSMSLGNSPIYSIIAAGPGSSVGIATDYWLDGRGSNPGGDEIFRPSRPALGPTQPPIKWLPGPSLGVKCGRGVLLTTHPLLVPRSRKSRVIPLPTVWASVSQPVSDRGPVYSFPTRRGPGPNRFTGKYLSIFLSSHIKLT
jgi:hypothetical protein